MRNSFVIHRAVKCPTVAAFFIETLRLNLSTQNKLTGSQPGGFFFQILHDEPSGPCFSVFPEHGQPSNGENGRTVWVAHKKPPRPHRLSTAGEDYMPSGLVDIVEFKFF